MSPWCAHSLNSQDKVLWEMGVHLEPVFPEMTLLCLIIVPGLLYLLLGMRAFSSGALLFGALLASFVYQCQLISFSSFPRPLD